MKVKSIAECSPWSILQYFWPALSDNRSWKPILVFFLSGRLRQVLLYFCFYSMVINFILNIWSKGVGCTELQICYRLQ